MYMATVTADKDEFKILSQWVNTTELLRLIKAGEWS